MRLALKIIAVLVILAVAGRFGVPALWAYWNARNKPAFRQAKIGRGEIVSVVNSSGTVQPVLNVQVGSPVSGPVLKVHVTFNDRVTKGQVLAEVDPLIYRAQRTQANAALSRANADLLQAQAKLDQAQQGWRRAADLHARHAVAEADYDLAKANFESGKANVAVCKAAIEQAKGALELAETNLNYTTIKSPVDGVVIDRKIDAGQTVAASFQTPELFKVAPDMDQRMLVYASVDEADIGLIRDAQQRGQRVAFTVDAYPNDLFEGKIFQVRLNPTTTQNVVTYSVIVETPNRQQKLLPGMTASLSFEIDKRASALRVPTAALRFFPKADLVREDDRKLLEGTDEAPVDNNDERPPEMQRSAMEKAEAGRKRNRRHVWIVEGERLKALEIVTGLSDNTFAEVVSGPLEEGQQVVTGMAPPKP